MSMSGGITPNNPAPSIGAQNALGRANGLIAASLERQSTGLRINRGADDPAGLISSEQLKAQLAVLEAETRSMERADAVAATADAALGEISGQMAEARALAVANANTGGMSDAEIAANEMEMASIQQSVDRQLRGAEFNGVKLFDGGVTLSAGGATLNIEPTTALTLGLSDVNFANPDEVSSAVGTAADRVNTLRGRIGAFQANVIGSRRASNAVEFENISAANSIIRDTDFAAESARFARASVLGASSGTALRLTNESPRNALWLLTG